MLLRPHYIYIFSSDFGLFVYLHSSAINDYFVLLPAARAALIIILPLISDTGAPLEQSQTTLLNP